MHRRAARRPGSCCASRPGAAQRGSTLTLGIMKLGRVAMLVALLGAGSVVPSAAIAAGTFYLRFSAQESRDLGPVEKLVVTVACGRISGLHEVPELYDSEMEYDTPNEQIFEARPRLSAAAVSLSQWSGVIGVRLPTGSDSKACFSVDVVAEGRTGRSKRWNAKQLGVPQ